MNRAIWKSGGINSCIIKCRWLLLFAIVISVALVSCSPRSVRNGKTRTVRYPVKEKTVENKSVKDIDNKEVIDARSQLEEELKLTADGNKSDTFYMDARTGIVMPKPSSADVMTIYDEQENINRKVSTLQTDVTEMKNTLEMIKSELITMNGKQPREDAVAGESSEGDDIPRKKANVMLSDEKVGKKPPVRTQNSTQVKKQQSVGNQPKPKTKVVRSNKPKKTEETEKTENDVQDFSQVDGSAENSDQGPDENIGGFNKAMEEFRSKNYRNAINELHEMMKNEKNPVNIGKYNYWLGESHFGLNQYDKAVNYFRKVLKSGNSAKKDDAMIMIAESQVRTGNVDEAKKTFSDLIACYPKSRYVPRARKMLQQL